MIDPNSPAPLYLQIAEAIRDRIRSGELASGESLEPLREAARKWNVNLHTVRHAYTALAREGLVETRGTRGTRVAAEKSSGEHPNTLSSPACEALVERFAREAAGQGLSREDLIRLLQRPRPDRPVAWVVECSRWQCECHAAELRRHLEIDAREWSLEREGEPPSDGLVVATYFHYNDIRLRWPHRLRHVRFVDIGPDPAIARELSGAGIARAWVFEHDPVTAATVAADLTPLLEESIEVEPRSGAEPRSLLRQLKENEAVLFPPRVWADLSTSDRAHPRAFEARYVLSEHALQQIARLLTGERPTGGE
ncbi:MAG TPA: GntR family transcriptional regulator [Acidimicrobiia bacterium]|jgi:DNA-binding transcriptional regulator YhcF (GntR family)